MKMNNKIIVKIVAILLLIGLIGTFTHCVPQMAKEVGSGGGSLNSIYEPTDADPLDEGQIINQLQVTTGVKNHEQILHTMAAVTGVDAFANGTLMGVYRQVESSLPTDNDIKVYTATQQVAVTKLAAEFCVALAANQTLRNNVWPVMMANYNQASGVAFNAANEALFIDQTINAFWGGVLSAEELTMARAELGILVDELINNENTTGATQRTVRGVCMAALSSAYVTLL
jgi:hypothetical protein